MTYPALTAFYAAVFALLYVGLSAWVAVQCAFTAGQQFVLNQPLFVAERTTPALLCVLAGVGWAAAGRGAASCCGAVPTWSTGPRSTTRSCGSAG